MSPAEQHPFETGLDRTRANFVPLSPLSFLARAAASIGDTVAVIDGDRRFTYRDLYSRCRRLASALSRRGVGRLDTVAIVATNTPEMIESFYGVPMIGAVLNPLNTRLDAATIAFSLKHGNAKALIVDADCAALVEKALKDVDQPLLVIDVPSPDTPHRPIGTVDYDTLLAEGDPDFLWDGPDDEWQSLCLLYTSGTTGDPKGAVYSHRGAYLQALGNSVTFGLTFGSVYLWTLPMFHCAGWSYPWATVAAGGTQVCLRKVEPATIFRLIADHGVTHMCGAPIVLSMLAHAPLDQRRPFKHPVRCATGGAAPSSTVLRNMEEMGFEVAHLYGATETYGPGTTVLFHPEWNALPSDERFALMARQGVPLTTVEALSVVDPVTMKPVPQDGVTIGDLVMRGNTVMKGYLKNPSSTRATLNGEWYISGDLAVWHPDGAVEIKDRSKDIIISGGENISSLEVEEVLSQHPTVMAAAVVARPDATWGETPCAFLELKSGAPNVTESEIVGFCRERLARFKVPKTIVFKELPRTSTGKIQKFVLREEAKHI